MNISGSPRAVGAGFFNCLYIYCLWFPLLIFVSYTVMNDLGLLDELRRLTEMDADLGLPPPGPPPVSGHPAVTVPSSQQQAPAPHATAPLSSAPASLATTTSTVGRLPSWSLSSITPSGQQIGHGTYTTAGLHHPVSSTAPPGPSATSCNWFQQWPSPFLGPQFPWQPAFPPSLGMPMVSVPMPSSTAYAYAFV